MHVKNQYSTLKIHLIFSIQLLILFPLILASCNEESLYDGPLSPEESLKTFQFSENFKAEIFAAEPLVVDPVAMQFDADGNAFVVGMLDAYKPDATKGKGNIVLLKDTDGDGQADTSTIFVDSLREATSILPWKGGLLVCAAPNITYYKDTDGDGRSDSKEVLFTGFFDKNEEAQITNLRYGIDNWIYANNAGQAGKISFSRNSDAPPIEVQGADFRFRLDKNLFERSTGPGQFGLAIDDWGHRFFTANSLHIRQVVIPMRYLERNPYLTPAAKNAIQNISDHDPLMNQISATPYWRQERTNRRNKNYKENNLDRVEYARDHFTGASGGTYYGGDKFTNEYYGNIFTADVAGNLIHRDILNATDSLPFLTAQQGSKEKDKEFMATTDTWFRPANFSVGPDGYLYLMDMYRQHIETPMSIPQDLQETMDFDAGNTFGRIYRIVQKNSEPYTSVSPNLTKANSSDLVNALQHENRWWRLTAQRLLLERQDKSIISEVIALFEQSEDPRFRLHALYVLEGLNALDATIIRTAMQDPSPGVRENAAMLAERFPSSLSLLKEMVNDSSVRVALQATLSIGQFKDDSVIPSLAKASELHGDSSWFRTAILSSEAGSSILLLKTLVQNSFFKETSIWKNTFIENFSYIIGARNDKDEILDLLNVLSRLKESNKEELQSSGLKGLFKGLEKTAELKNSSKEKIKTISSEAENNIANAIQHLKELFTKL
ncbi:PVC-type heme-binding CxxCH protein [Aurantibacter sp.]|uniref:PVC-type heme-binding CxxCH protein n=1 Tax=Aurantibacter sp. TaxID=2807103 RepID=UPI0032673BE4